MSYALILLAHGSSDPKWRAPFEQFRDALVPRLGTPIRLAYMELCEPSLEATVAELSEGGIHQIEVLPLFFAAGRHLRKDVPAQIDALKAEPRPAVADTASTGWRTPGLRRSAGQCGRGSGRGIARRGPVTHANSVSEKQ